VHDDQFCSKVLLRKERLKAHLTTPHNVSFPVQQWSAATKTTKKTRKKNEAMRETVKDEELLDPELMNIYLSDSDESTSHISTPHTSKSCNAVDIESEIAQLTETLDTHLHFAVTNPPIMAPLDGVRNVDSLITSKLLRIVQPGDRGQFINWLPTKCPVSVNVV